jgi:hypothetical protein
MKSKSIRVFIGAKDFEVARAFYTALDFTEITLGATMSYFQVNETLGFYLQDAYVKDWVDNSMIFLEVEHLEDSLKELKAKRLTERFPTVRLSNIKNEPWGSEFFLHDPSGILWHFGTFKS